MKPPADCGWSASVRIVPVERRFRDAHRSRNQVVRQRRPSDGEVSLGILARRRPEGDLDARMLWLLASAKANQAERFGVGLAELYGRTTSDSHPVRVHVQLQETYHTRILADVVAIFGLPVH